MILSATVLTIKSRSLLSYQREESWEAVQHHNPSGEHGLGLFCSARWAGRGKLYPLKYRFYMGELKQY